MAALPSPTQVAGAHSTIYEAYYNLVDPKGYGSVSGNEAARFLKKSGLSDVILSKIWDMSDPAGHGCLDRRGFFVAMKLVALVQNGRDLSIMNVQLDVPPPKLGDIPNLPKPMKPPPPTSVAPLISSLPVTAVDWTVKLSEREKYEKLFDSLQPLNGHLPGNKVKNVLMESKLPIDTLGRIWELADQDKDGMLDRFEFIAAMHLVYKALEKHTIPETLPIELLPPTKRKPSINSVSLLEQNNHNILLDTSITKPSPPILPSMPAQITQPTISQAVEPSSTWVVTPEERIKYNAMFIKSDIDRDGFVSGQEIKDVFLASGVPQHVLANIWSLCDIRQAGKLNSEQFALAMWLVARCLRGIEPPRSLTPEMIPPSFRSETVILSNEMPLTGATTLPEKSVTYSNPELQMIQKDINELAREKATLELEIAQKDADIRIKSSEVKNLQSELDTLATTLKQLENQKGEAQKRLNDIKSQVDRLRVQASEQAEIVTTQEVELNTKKQQLEDITKEEEELEMEKNLKSRELERLEKRLQDSQLRISNGKALLTQLEEQKRQMSDAIATCNGAMDSGDATLVPDMTLRLSPDFRDESYKRFTMEQSNLSEDDPFQSSDNQADSGHVSNGQSSFGFEDAFKSDNIYKTNNATTVDPFANSTSFRRESEHSAFEIEPFGSHSTDPFNANFDSFNNNLNGASNNDTNTVASDQKDKDPFGCDPFAVLHAPTRDGSTPCTTPNPLLIRSTSPSPALPPKKCKQPPPRPAPPRPNQLPSYLQDQNNKINANLNKYSTSSYATDSDPFSASNTGASSDSFTGGSGGGFADFSDFDAKLTQNYINNNSILNTIGAQSNKAPPKKLDFVDDPFKNYRYEDTANICFEEDTTLDNLNANTNLPFDPFGLSTSTATYTSAITTITTGRQSAPLIGLASNRELNNNFFSNPSNDLFSFDNSTTISNSVINTDGRASAPIALSEDQQLAWAAQDSLKLDSEWKRRQLQEQADLELALTLSTIEVKKH